MAKQVADQFCHLLALKRREPTSPTQSTSFTLCFDQGQVLLLHAPRYMGLNGHVTLAQTDMSLWRKQTCLLGVSRHVTFGATDMSPWMRPPWSTLTLHFKPKNHLASLAASASPCAKLQFSENHACVGRGNMIYLACTARKGGVFPTWGNALTARCTMPGRTSS